MVAEAPDGADCRDSNRMRLVMMETSNGALKEGSDGWLLEMGGELGADPEAATEKERVGGAVQVGQNHVAHEAAEVELDKTLLDLGFYCLLCASQGKHCCFMHLKSITATLHKTEMPIGSSVCRV